VPRRRSGAAWPTRYLVAKVKGSPALAPGHPATGVIRMRWIVGAKQLRGLPLAEPDGPILAEPKRIDDDFAFVIIIFPA